MPYDIDEIIDFDAFSYKKLIKDIMRIFIIYVVGEYLFIPKRE